MNRKQGRMMSNNMFAIQRERQKIKSLGYPSYVRKALSNLKLTGGAAEAIREACKATGVRYESPGIVGDVAIHFTFPKYKAGILLTSNMYAAGDSTKVSKCRSLGWNVVAILTRKLEIMPSDTVIAQFKEYIVSLKASCK